ncbi:MAG: hypothetical protein AB7O26_21250 [Planctomycetaceae bacterium]
MNRLQGITRPGSTPLANPAAHCPLMLQNRVQAEIVAPDGTVKHRIDHTGNIMATYGLNRLIEMLASDTNGASRWASAMAIGTSTTAAASTQDSLVASTQIVHLSQASMVASDAGARTLQYNGTFASNGNACQIHEVGLFATNNATQHMIARSVLGTDSINRGASDEIRISYQIIAGTA